jgi:Rad3-related DNA helicase
MVWSLKEEDKDLKPLKFSNGKTQEDVVNEVISSIKAGEKIIFIRGVCGTGKSAIALNIAKELGRTSIVVPVKALQKQYEEDYINKKSILKDNGEKLKIKILTGRQNFICPFLKERKEVQELKREKNAKIDDFFRNLRGEGDIVKLAPNLTCDNKYLPCKIELKDKNIKIIRQYLRENPRIKSEYFTDMSKVKRFSIAPICPYWSPIAPAEVEISLLKDATRKEYLGLNKRKYNFYHRKEGCGYYDQYQSYIDADVLIFNSFKYKLEMFMNRKPETEVEIIDECDEFLDNFANVETINLNRLMGALATVFSENESAQSRIIEIAEIISNILKDEKTEEFVQHGDIIPLKETKIIEIISRFLDSNFMNYVELDEENYCYHCDEVARLFEHFLDDTFVSLYREDKNVFVKFVTVNLEKKFKEMIEKNKALVLMSGTLHSETVLKEIFGIDNFKVIDAETKMPGKIIKLRTGCEINCRYSNFKSNKISREQYLLSLNSCLTMAHKPVLIHVNSFSDLPSEQEASKLKIDIMTREKLLELQESDKHGEAVQKFKRGEIEVLYSTKCNRGVDFPGGVCNSIILTRYPYPNVGSVFWRVLRSTKPEHYNSFYVDKAKREFLQRIYRAVRSQNDQVYLLSPDIRVFENF